MQLKILGALMICACLLAAPFASANAQGARINPSAMSAFLMDLQSAVTGNDRAAVASMVSYPLHVGAKNYTSSATLIADFDKIFTPSIKAAIANARSSTMSSSAQGPTIGNGQILLINSNGFPKIASVNPAQ